MNVIKHCLNVRAMSLSYVRRLAMGAMVVELPCKMCLGVSGLTLLLRRSLGSSVRTSNYMLSRLVLVDMFT